MREVICSAPGRMALVGNPFDIYGGMTIAMTLRDLRSVVQVERSDEKEINSDIFRPGKQKTKQRRELELTTLEELDLQHHTLWHYDGSNMPYESALARSTAAVVAMIRAYSKLFGRGIVDPYEVAEQAWAIERKIGVCGGQERYAIAFDHEDMPPEELQTFLAAVKSGRKASETRPGKLFFMDFTGREDHYHNGHNFAKIRQLTQMPVKFAIAFQAEGARLNSFSVHQRLRERYVSDETVKERIAAYRSESNAVVQDALLSLDNGSFNPKTFGDCMKASLDIRLRMMNDILGEELSGEPLCEATMNMISIAQGRDLMGYNQPGSKSLCFMYEDNRDLCAFTNAGYRIIKVLEP